MAGSVQSSATVRGKILLGRFGAMERAGCQASERRCFRAGVRWPDVAGPGLREPGPVGDGREEARTCGRIRLALTDRLAIDVASKDGEFRPVISFANTDEDRHLFNGVIEWSVQSGSFAAYASDAEMLVSTGRSIQQAIDRDAYVLLEHGQFSFARVGDIVVIFEKDDRKKESSSDDEADEPASKASRTEWPAHLCLPARP